MKSRLLLLAALLPLAGACTRTAVEPLGRPYIRAGAGDAATPPAEGRREPVGERVPTGARLPAGIPAGLSSGLDGAGGALPVTHHEDVIRFLNRFAYDARGSFATWLERRSRYESMILPRLAARGVPADMVHLALIESGFDPDARSHADAVGMWQFIESTARLEGLEVSRYVDDRRDPVRATEAAARHLAGLYERFGSWYLAAAAYNGGAGRIERALAARAGGARGADSLFWVIQPILPRETQEYVPKLLAAAVVGRSPASFGLPVIPAPPETPVDTVLVSDALPLDRAAALAGLDAGLVRHLNPRYILGTTPPGRSSPLLLPRGTGAGFLAALAAAPPLGQPVGVPPLGQPVGVPAGSGAGAASPSRGLAGSAVGATGAAGTAGTAAGSTPLHEVQRGDTVWSIARRYGVHPHDLLNWNGLDLEDTIRPGDRLRLAPAR